MKKYHSQLVYAIVKERCLERYWHPAVAAWRKPGIGVVDLYKRVQFHPIVVVASHRGVEMSQIERQRGVELTSSVERCIAIEPNGVNPTSGRILRQRVDCLCQRVFKRSFNRIVSGIGTAWVAYLDGDKCVQGVDSGGYLFGTRQACVAFVDGADSDIVYGMTGKSIDGERFCCCNKRLAERVVSRCTIHNPTGCGALLCPVDGQRMVGAVCDDDVLNRMADLLFDDD